MNELAKGYYNRIDVQFELIKVLKDRETSFLTMVQSEDDKKYAFRCIMIRSIEYLNRNFDAFHFLQRNMNIYISLASVFNMPVFSYWMETRMEQQKSFNAEFHKYVKGYDLAFDFDGKKDFNKCYEQTKSLKEKFDAFEVPYSLVFSGAGFHIRIEYNNLPFKMKEITKESLTKFVKRLQKIVYNIADIFDFETLDRGVYDPRRIWKCPYSIDFRSGNISLPLTNEEFNNFVIQRYSIMNSCHLKVYNRGMLTRTGNQDGLKRFFKEYL